MSKENLINLADRPKEERVEIAKKGGKKSGEVRAKKKNLKDELLMVLNAIEDGDNITLQTKTCIALINKALEGNIKAFEVIRDTVEGKPIQSTKEENIQDVKVQIIDDLESEISKKQLQNLLSILSTEELQRLANCEDSDILKLSDEDCNLLQYKICDK